MSHPDYVDAEMRELLNVLGTAIIPRAKRGAVVRTNWHTPCHSRNRNRYL